MFPLKMFQSIIDYGSFVVEVVESDAIDMHLLKTRP